MQATIYINTDTLSAHSSTTSTACPSAVARLQASLDVTFHFFETDEDAAALSGSPTFRFAVKEAAKPTGDVLILDSSAVASGTGYTFSFASVDSDALRTLLADSESVDCMGEIEWTIASVVERVHFPVLVQNAWVQSGDSAPDPVADASWDWLKAKVLAGTNITRTLDEDADTMTIGTADNIEVTGSIYAGGSNDSTISIFDRTITHTHGATSRVGNLFFPNFANVDGNRNFLLPDNSTTGTQTIITSADVGTVSAAMIATAPALSAANMTDFPTLNQHTSGTAAGLSSTLVVSSGGTGLTTLGTANQVLATNASATAMEWQTVSAGSGTVTSVDTAGTVNGLTLTGGPITESGTITLDGTLDLSTPPAIGGTTPAAGTFTTLIAGNTTSLLLGTAGSTVGNIGFRNATSGTATLAPPTGALGTYTVTLPGVASTLSTLGANTYTALQTITQASANAGILASTGYSLTGSDATSMINLAGTWNTSGTPTALKLNITDTASNASSKLFDFQVGGVSKVRALKDGDFYATYLSATGGFVSFDASFTRYFRSVTSGISSNVSVGTVTKLGLTSNVSLDVDAFFMRDTAATIQMGANAAGVVTPQTFKACDRITSDGVGADLIIAGGRNRGASAGGSVKIQTAPIASAGVTGTLTTRMTIDSEGVNLIANATTVPSATPSGGGYMYVEAGALKWKGSSGTVTTIAVA